MATTYSPIAESDIAVAVDMMEKFYAIDGYPIDRAVSEKLFAEFIDDENLGRSWVILSDGMPAGYVILSFSFSFIYEGKMAFIDELYIDESARGKGIGKRTLEFIKAESKNLGVKVMYLEVEHHNSIAQKLYLSAGFETHMRKFMQYKIK